MARQSKVWQSKAYSKTIPGKASGKEGKVEQNKARQIKAIKHAKQNKTKYKASQSKSK
jgi:hypothetical protein